jgi:hypothetical protein
MSAMAIFRQSVRDPEKRCLIQGVGRIHLTRGVRCGLLALVFTIALTLAAVPVQQQILRRRAEHLLGDIRQLNLRGSTWSDAQNLFNRWGRWGHYDGACTPQACSYWIELGDLSNRHPRLAPIILFAQPIYRFFGGRMSLVRAEVTVNDGLIWEKGFSVFVQVPAERSPNNFEYGLIGSAWSVSHFRVARPSLADHPNYVVWTPDGCTGCLAVIADFTPYADQDDVARLMDFNLSCLTKRDPCREREEIMPSAWNQYLVDGAKAHGVEVRENCSLYPLKVLGRDTTNAAIVDVVVDRMEGRGADAFQVSKVRLITRLKGASFWGVGETREVRIFERSVSHTSHNKPADAIPGARFILLFSHAHWGGPSGPEVWLDSCGALPFTEQNLGAIKRGVDEDYLAARRDDDEVHGP